MKQPKRIVLTGGACAGKTTGLVRIWDRLEKMGWHPIVVPEVATLMFRAAGRPNFSDRVQCLLFQKAMIKAQLQLEETMLELAQSYPKAVLLLDRGAMDSKAFLAAEDWQMLLQEVGTNEVELRDLRYDAVIHMVTAADGAPDAYKLDDIRTETPQQAIAQDQRLQAAYLGHGHHKIIDNHGTFDQKLLRVEAEICRILGDPEPLELERKFLLRNSPLKFTSHCASSTITQTYLKSATDEERRVRRRIYNNNAVYTKGLKRKLGNGLRVEVEEFISGTEYLRLLETAADPKAETITKTRHCFIHDNRVYELDEYTGRLQGLWVLEIEVENMDTPVVLPGWAQNATEVTNNTAYSNYGLAHKK